MQRKCLLRLVMSLSQMLGPQRLVCWNEVNGERVDSPKKIVSSFFFFFNSKRNLINYQNICIYIHCTSRSKLLYLVVVCGEDIVRRLSRLILSTERENNWRNGTGLNGRMWLKWIWSFITHLTFQNTQRLVLNYSEPLLRMRISSRRSHTRLAKTKSVTDDLGKALNWWIQFVFFFCNLLCFAKDSCQELSCALLARRGKLLRPRHFKK